MPKGVSFSFAVQPCRARREGAESEQLWGTAGLSGAGDERLRGWQAQRRGHMRMTRVCSVSPLPWPVVAVVAAHLVKTARRADWGPRALWCQLGAKPVGHNRSEPVLTGRQRSSECPDFLDPESG